MFGFCTCSMQVFPLTLLLFLTMYKPKLSWNAKVSYNTLDFYKLLIKLFADLSPDL